MEPQSLQEHHAQEASPPSQYSRHSMPLEIAVKSMKGFLSKKKFYGFRNLVANGLL